jgi:DNA-binding transcriptional regulator LsrR (DeoR family)
VTTEEIEQLSRNHIVSLVAVVRALKSKKKQYVELKDVRLHAAELAEQLGIKKMEVEDYLDDLKARRLVEMRSLKEIGLHGASLAELEPVLMAKVKKQ